MQLSTLLISVMASLAIAVPTNTGGGGGGGGDGGSTPPAPYDACGGSVLLNAQPNCCSTNVGDIVGLTCATVSEQPTSADSFKEICAASGQTAYCCTAEVIGVGVLCNTPVGV